MLAPFKETKVGFFCKACQGEYNKLVFFCKLLCFVAEILQFKVLQVWKTHENFKQAYLCNEK